MSKSLNWGRNGKEYDYNPFGKGDMVRLSFDPKDRIFVIEGVDVENVYYTDANGLLSYRHYSWFVLHKSVAEIRVEKISNILYV